MTIWGRAALALLITASPALSGEGEASARHAVWRGCLQRSFGLQATLTSKTIAVDSALAACRGAESAYLTALSASPLLDGDDVARARPALLERAKDWLLGRGGPRTL